MIKFTIKWDAGSQRLTYQLQGMNPVTVDIGSVGINTVFGNGTTEVYWGFTGATGGNYQVNRVTFDEVPGLVNATVSETIKKADSSDAANTLVYGGEELTYTIKGTYDSGKQDWFNVKLGTTINDFVTYVPGSLTITYPDGRNEEVNDDSAYWSGQTLSINLGNLTSADNEATASFKVKVNTVTADTPVTETAKFSGGNLILDTNSISYTIKRNQVPVVTLDNANTTVEITNGDPYTISGTWRDSDSNTVDLYYVIGGGTPVKFAADAANDAVKGKEVDYSYIIPAAQLSVGTHTVTVYAIDDVKASSNNVTLTLAVTGRLAFTNVSDNISFEDTNLSGTTTFAKRSGDWNVIVQDARGTRGTWRVEAALSAEFSDGTHTLVDALTYIDSTGAERTIGKTAVKVYEHTTIDTDAVSIASWDDNKGILLKVSPSFYRGDYTGTITWSLVDAP